MLVEIMKFGKEEKSVVTSLDIAETFEKEHKNVLRDIRELECSEEFRRLNFEQSEYLNEQSHKQPMYLIMQWRKPSLVRSENVRKALQYDKP